MRAQHRAARVKLHVFLARTRLLVVLTTPVIYSLIIPFVLLDLFVSLYQAICFPVYGIAKVRRRDHIVIDRHHLAYLNGIQKLNCVYCGYGNGVFPTRAKSPGGPSNSGARSSTRAGLPVPHAHYPGFVDYGDAQAFHDQTLEVAA